MAFLIFFEAVWSLIFLSDEDRTILLQAAAAAARESLPIKVYLYSERRGGSEVICCCPGDGPPAKNLGEQCDRGHRCPAVASGLIQRGALIRRSLARQRRVTGHAFGHRPSAKRDARSLELRTYAVRAPDAACISTDIDGSVTPVATKRTMRRRGNQRRVSPASRWTLAMCALRGDRLSARAR